MRPQRPWFAALGFSLLIGAGAAHADPDPAPEKQTYVPTKGFKIADTALGTMNLKFFSYVRYLNQQGLDAKFTDSFGRTSNVKRRGDFQLNKAQLTVLGWFMSPKFRYLGYVWSCNASQGLGAQVVVAGNLTYRFDEHFTFGGGIGALPGTHTLEGTFPYWLPVDNRLIADEYFRPSYTTGIWSSGQIVDRVEYQIMLGNNLSQLGVDAGQIDKDLNTWSGALVWMPTTGEFGRGFGDYENHANLATRLAGHFTRSDEDRQSQPGTEAPENSQIRLSDGNVIFTPGLFGPGILIDDVRYQMLALDVGVKKRGISLEADFYRRWVDEFRGRGTEGLNQIVDNGFQVFASAMVKPEMLQAYAGGAKIYGDFGDPAEFRFGVNCYPYRNEAVRVNLEYIQLKRSPVGGLSLPQTVGGNGPVFNFNFMIYL